MYLAATTLRIAYYNSPAFHTLGGMIMAFTTVIYTEIMSLMVDIAKTMCVIA
jgi:hypothetical protein